MVEPLVGVIMGSRSDWNTMRHTAETLGSFGVSFETRVLSAHRTPDELAEYAATAEDRGLEVIIAAAGGAAALRSAAAAAQDGDAVRATSRACAHAPPAAATPARERL